MRATSWVPGPVFIPISSTGAVTDGRTAFLAPPDELDAWAEFVAGVDVPVARSVDLFVQYKLLGVGETEYQRTDLVVDIHFTHNLVFGARLSF